MQADTDTQLVDQGSSIRIVALYLQIPVVLILLYITVQALLKTECEETRKHTLAVLNVAEALGFDLVWAICFGMVVVAVRRRASAFAMVMSILGVVVALVMAADAALTSICFMAGW